MDQNGVVARRGREGQLAATTVTARYREVLRVLARNGFGFVVGGRGQRRALNEDETELRTRPVRLRRVFEELGTTFIKLGQILSTRQDLLPPAYIAELQKLQDAVPPLPTPVIVRAIEAELGQPIAALFTAFDPVPLAAASIAQVHAVTLPGGTDAVVKVQRPGVREQVALDLEIAARLAHLIAGRLNLAERLGLDLPVLVEEFAYTLRGELDYLREARNAEAFANNFAEEPSVYIPAICWEYTTPRLITMERLRGVRVDDLPAIRAAGYDPAALAVRSARLVLKEVFEDGFFHADLHPGNLFVMPGDVIGVIDFGMVGRLDDTTRTQLLLLVISVVDQDVDRITDSLARLGVVSGVSDRAALRRDIQRLVAEYYGLALEQVNLGRLVTDLSVITRRHALMLPPDLALLLKMLLMVEGVARTLDPAFNILAVAQPYGAEAIKSLFTPARIRQQLLRTAFDLADLSVDLPRRLDRVLRSAEQSTFTAREAADRAQRLVQTAVNRLAVGVLIGAFIVGLAIVILAVRPEVNDLLLRLMLLGGFAAVGVLGLVFFVSFLRSGR